MKESIDISAILRGKTETESFAHATARSLMADWLRARASQAGVDGNCTAFGAISWRVNRSGPHFGVWTEYPFVDRCFGGCSPVWDEFDSRFASRPPTFDECVDLGAPPLAISDVAIQHKGAIAHVIEIVHKHEPEPYTLRYLLENFSEVWVVPARWVLGQLRVPSRIPAEFRVSP